HAQKVSIRELMQGVVDGRQTDTNIGRKRLAVQLLSGDVTIAIVEKQASQRQPLPGRAKTGLLQALHERGVRTILHAPYIRSATTELKPPEHYDKRQFGTTQKWWITLRPGLQ